MSGSAEDSGRRPWRPLVAVAVALALWGLMLAVGAYLQVGADRAERDPRKFWIVMGCTAGFLAFWGAALWIRQRRLARERKGRSGRS